MEKQNQVQKKSTGSNVLIILLILIILATSAFGIFAWARYQTSVEGEGTAQVAQWNFKVTGNGTQTEQVSFLMTRTDNNNTVATGTIAPGTYGEIPIEIDVTGTQTDLIYTISGSTVNMPRNLKLYYDAARTEEMVVFEQEFSKGNYLKVADIGTGSKVITETIYWEWPFETGTEESVILENNQKDTEDMGKAMTIALTVEGKQLNGAPVLADLVQVGDYVNYDANSNGEQTFTSSDCLEGTSIDASISTAENFDSNAKSQWRVLSVDRTNGEVELMSTDATAQIVTLSGIDGYVNAETVLNNIGKIYDNGQGAKPDSGRSMTFEDIEAYSSYDKDTYVTSEGGYSLGTVKSYTFKTLGNSSENLAASELIKLTGSDANPAEVTHTSYFYKTKNYYSNSSIYNMIFKKSNDINTDKDNFWLASRCVYCNIEHCNFRVRCVAKGTADVYTLYYSSGYYDSDRSCKAVPVVSLNTNIQTIGKDANGVWQLKVN